MTKGEILDYDAAWRRVDDGVVQPVRVQVMRATSDHGIDYAGALMMQWIELVFRAGAGAAGRCRLILEGKNVAKFKGAQRDFDLG